jgi:peptidoglycan/LPS O-acetylase OafA/YrhL
LDVLRCIAAVLVIFRHSGIQSRFAHAVWVGVDLFFVLSGFLISGLLFSEYKLHGAISFKRFFIRRGFKIYPAFYLLLLFTVVIQSVSGRWSSLAQYLTEASYFQNYGRHIFAHTWSLAVEEHFYILLPVILLVMIRFSPNRDDPFRRIPVVFAAIAIICLAIRAATAFHIPTSELEDWEVYRRVLARTHERIDSLLFGVLIGYVHHFRPELFGKWLESTTNRVGLAMLACALVMPAIFYPPQNRFMLTIGLTMLYLGFGIALVLSLHVKNVVPASVEAPLKWLGTGLAFIGVYSYSIYLWHTDIMAYGAHVVRKLTHYQLHGSLLEAFYFPAAIAFGIVMSRLIEQPCLKLRDRIFPSMQSVRVARRVCADVPSIASSQD